MSSPKAIRDTNKYKKYELPAKAKYNKKMQKLSDIEADKRYTFLLDAMNKLNKLSIQDFVYYGENGSYQTIPFNNILKNMTDWMTDRNKYNTRFERKKIPPGFIVNRLNLKF